jgi:hypothetical protein
MLALALCLRNIVLHVREHEGNLSISTWGRAKINVHSPQKHSLPYPKTWSIDVNPDCLVKFRDFPHPNEPRKTIVYKNGHPLTSPPSSLDIVVVANCVCNWELRCVNSKISTQISCAVENTWAQELPVAVHTSDCPRREPHFSPQNLHSSPPISNYMISGGGGLCNKQISLQKK